MLAALVAIDPPIEWPTIMIDASLYFAQTYLKTSMASLIKVASLKSVGFSVEFAPWPLKSKATTVESVFNYFAKDANERAEWPAPCIHKNTWP